MSLIKITKVGVIGAGTMGRGIAQVFAIYNYPVTLLDKKETILLTAIEKVKEWTDPELWDKVSNLIKISTNIEELRDCNLVIEAVFEDMSVKKKILNTLNSVCERKTIFVTNTSTLSVNELAVSVDNPSRFIGMHFMNPPKAMKLVEIVRGDKTSEETVQTITYLTKDIEKIPAVVNDSPGFVSNRLLFALIGEAMRLLERGVATKEDIDAVMKYGMNHPLGPIELADFIGLDICQKIMQTLHKDLGDEKYKPPHLLDSLVRDGKLGIKTGEGFYRYP